MYDNGTMYLIDSYHRYPEVFELIINYRETMMLAVRVMFLLLTLLVARGAISTCTNLFSGSLHTELFELQNKLSEAEDSFDTLVSENEDLEKKLEDTRKELEATKKRLKDLDSRYMCCREAAQKFIDTNPKCDTQG
jgi:septal ring factor EnvC (AmiA/AmiB activator)